ncbi:hypothetical protein LCGC14_1873340, partial [marine sediment metagenome]
QINISIIFLNHKNYFFQTKKSNKIGKTVGQPIAGLNSMK